MNWVSDAGAAEERKLGCVTGPARLLAVPSMLGVSVKVAVAAGAPVTPLTIGSVGAKVRVEEMPGQGRHCMTPSSAATMPVLSFDSQKEAGVGDPTTVQT